MIDYRLYIPEDVKILSVREESDSVRTYRLKGHKGFKAGQFFQVSVLGAGEVPISISSSPLEKDFMELTVRNIGKVTRAIYNLTKEDSLGLRGPFGNFFPIEEMRGKELIFVAGGIGLAPLRPLITYLLHNRERYGKVHLLYGARTQGDMIFKDDLKKWLKLKDLNTLLTIDEPEKSWTGSVGVVTALFKGVSLDTHNPAAFVCGPPIMMRYTLHELLRLGLSEDDIFVTLERYMKCGVGKCGHCYISDKYVCTDGPVFSFRQIRAMHPEEVIA